MISGPLPVYCMPATNSPTDAFFSKYCPLAGVIPLPVILVIIMPVAGAVPKDVIPDDVSVQFIFKSAGAKASATFIPKLVDIWLL